MSYQEHIFVRRPDTGVGSVRYENVLPNPMFFRMSEWSFVTGSKIMNKKIL